MLSSEQRRSAQIAFGRAALPRAAPASVPGARHPLPGAGYQPWREWLRAGGGQVKEKGRRKEKGTWRREGGWSERNRSRRYGPAVGSSGSAAWARPETSEHCWFLPTAGPGRRRQAGWCSEGWEGAWWRRSGPSPSSCSGPTQSHKTSGLAVPAILGWDGPVIAASVKTDLSNTPSSHRRSCGVVLCFDPSGSTGLDSVNWSPLPASRTWPGARRAAAGLTDVAKTSVGTMSDGDFWYATATKMLAPLLFAASVGGRGMADVVRWVATQEETEVIDLLVAAGVPEAIHSAQSTFGKEDRQRSSIYTTVETILEPFADGARSG